MCDTKSLSVCFINGSIVSMIYMFISRDGEDKSQNLCIMVKIY